MRSLFPAMEDEIRDDRKAAKRERVQHARNWLKDRDLSWLINYLLEHGPTNEHELGFQALEEHSTFPFTKDTQGVAKLAEVFGALINLNAVGKLWKKPIGTHPGSGEESYLWGIRGVHQKPKSK